MIFLNPTILFGLLAASIPILIHLLNLRKLKKIEFSTLSFLKELQKTKIRRIKLKQWILLLLRVLIILLLVFAFARPTLQSITLGDSSSSAKTTAVIIVDNSFSMSVVNDKGSYINQAKTIVKDLSNEFIEGDDVSVFLTSELGTNEYINIPLSRIEEVSKNISISLVSGNLLSTVNKAITRLNQSDNFNKEIYLISDFQENEFNSNRFETVKGIANTNSINFYTIDVANKNISNLAVTSFNTDNQIFELNKPISFSASIANYSEQTINNSVVSLFINGVRKAQQSISLNAGETKKIEFNTTLDKKGLLEAYIELDDDDILQDNKRFLAINVPENIRIVLFSKNPKDIEFLKLVLTATNISNNITLAEKSLKQISSINYNDYDLVVICGAEGINNLDKLSEFLSAGGSLMIFPSSNEDLNSLSSFYTKLQLPSPVRKIASQNESDFLTIEEIDLAHPIFSDLFEEDQKEIASPKFYKSFEFYTRGDGKPVIELNNGSSFLAEFKYNTGTIFAFNSAPELSSNNFPLKSIFAPLISKSISYLTANSQSDKNAIAGEKIEVNILNKSYPQIKVERPEKTNEFIELEKNYLSNYKEFTNTETAGLYKFYQDDILTDYAVINFDPLESQVKYLSDDGFDNVLNSINFEGNHISLNADDNFNKIIYQARFGTELWRYFLFAAFILALLEMFISKSTKKDLAEIA